MPLKRTPLKPRKKPLPRGPAPKRKTKVKAVNKARLARRQKAYDAYMGSEAWRTLRRKVLERDRYICQRCRAGELDGVAYRMYADIYPDIPIYREFHVHHKTYARFGHENLDDLLTLCRACHMAEEAKKPIKPRFLRKKSLDKP